MFYEICQTPLGKFYALESRGFLVGFLPFLKQGDFQRQQTSLLKETKNQVQAYFDRRLKTFDLPLNFCGETFQQKVWQEIKRIPYGEVRSYKQIAKQLHSKAFRAVGSICGKNPLCIIVPCHRVVSSGFSERNLKLIGGYAMGLEAKKFLLHLEGSLLI